MLFTSKTLNTLIVASSLAAASAAASDKFEATFAFSRTAPVKVTYAQFEAQSAEQCKLLRSEVQNTPTRLHLERACSSALIDKAVAATQLEALIRHHRRVTNKSSAGAFVASSN